MEIDNAGALQAWYVYSMGLIRREDAAGNYQTYHYDLRGSTIALTDTNGLYQILARYYNPEIKRFVNRDVLTGSIDNGLTMNRYAYVNGNPVSYIDPFGLSADGADWTRTAFSVGADAIPFVGTVKGLQDIYWCGSDYRRTTISFRPSSDRVWNSSKWTSFR
ncbi:RHS repeat-associated core domain-containing protein [Paenibacillus shenyangensis]|uniref:RHS repeat-associated core domain-containing protein n=1 Tax=Paenibacillus sp. A9 TaxID=1284352 RepID=UPI0003672478|nr:RHS repeat-associated core domain-containing protein [Paenibacillus sp. A9]